MTLKKISLALVGASMAFAGVGCTTTVSGPTAYQDCYYDYYGYYTCDYYYYNGDGTTDTSRDMITDIAQAEQQKLDTQAKHYANKFSLSEEQGMKIAKTINDFNAVKNRSDADVADFAQRLYGVNPAKIVAAAGKAQAGDNTELNSVVAEAAKNFNTTSDNMKSIVKTLHGKMLEQQGIRF
jgi:hypothetical protein